MAAYVLGCLASHLISSLLILLSLTMSYTSSESSSSSDDSCYLLSSSSKREYLLAQIRQKDAIIESLLKQVSGSYRHLI
jgi:hypothetical protein